MFVKQKEKYIQKIHQHAEESGKSRILVASLSKLCKHYDLRAVDSALSKLELKKHIRSLKSKSDWTLVKHYVKYMYDIYFSKGAVVTEEQKKKLLARLIDTAEVLNIRDKYYRNVLLFVWIAGFAYVVGRRDITAKYLNVAFNQPSLFNDSSLLLLKWYYVMSKYGTWYTESASGSAFIEKDYMIFLIGTGESGFRLDCLRRVMLYQDKVYREIVGDYEMPFWEDEFMTEPEAYDSFKKHWKIHPESIISEKEIILYYDRIYSAVDSSVCRFYEDLSTKSIVFNNGMLLDTPNYIGTAAERYNANLHLIESMYNYMVHKIPISDGHLYQCACLCFSSLHCKLCDRSYYVRDFMHVYLRGAEYIGGRSVEREILTCPGGHEYAQYTVSYIL